MEAQVDTFMLFLRVLEQLAAVATAAALWAMYFQGRRKL